MSNSPLIGTRWSIKSYKSAFYIGVVVGISYHAERDTWLFLILSDNGKLRSECLISMYKLQPEEIEK